LEWKSRLEKRISVALPARAVAGRQRELTEKSFAAADDVEPHGAEFGDRVAVV
jgi:hypothetical protein